MRVTKNNQLNINNTFKLLNLSVYLEHDRKVLHSRNQDELHKIELLLEAGNAQGYTFILEDNISINMINNALDAGAYVKYLVGTIPINLIFEVGNNRNFEVLYRYHKTEFTQKELENFDRARQVFRVSLYIPVKKDMDIKQMLFNLNDTRFIIERAYFDFTTKDTDELDTKYKVEFFGKIHEILARWHIQVHLGSNSPEAQDELRETILGLNENNKI